MSENTPGNIQTDTNDSWHVQVAQGDVRVMTLEQLDEAFNAGLIVETTNVWQDGMDHWLTLGEMAGLGGDDAGSEAASVPQPPQQPIAAAPVQPAYAAPLQAPFQQTSALGQSVAPANPFAAAQQPFGARPAASFAPQQQFGAQAAPSFAPQQQQFGVQSVPALGSHPSFVPASASFGPGGMPTRSAPMSMAPMAIDLGALDLTIKPRGKGGLWALGIVAAAGIGLFAYNASFALNHNKVVAPMIEDTPTVAAAPPRAVEPAPAPKRVEEAPKEKEASTKSGGSSLGSQMATSLNMKTVKGGGGSRKGGGQKSKATRAGAKAGMSDFDPMNGQL